ncbi:MAG: GyrI-like domain-containing protein, partial [Croceimicrobium sp.]
VDASYAAKVLEWTKKEKQHPLLAKAKFEKIEDGPSLQMLHNGPFDNEPETFKIMQAYADAEGLKRKSMVHREIYLSDARKTAPEKLKTVLRFGLD